MRNLSLLSGDAVSLSGTNICATSIDLDQNVLYAASERQNQVDADIEIEVWKVILDDKTGRIKDQDAHLLTMFSTTAAPVSKITSQVASFRVLPESNRLSLIMRGGDIAVLSLDDDDPVAEVEGTVEPGIFGASWSPDDSLVVLVTGEDKLILMTSTFDVLSETSLHTADFGEDAPINVGWGSKQTQFHGSAGKAAAQATPSSVQALSVGSSPDDDTLPRISWRGDGAFFVVSALSLPSYNNTRRRTVRVYDRQAALQSTSEAVAGLEHTLAWRPSGNLIASTQRFGFEGGGAGKEGRHDVVFLERNGLRHGEFGLREHECSHGRVLSEGQKWGYKVREISWNSDSIILGVWIERNEGDIVQLWATGNYHWYLKHEILAPSSALSEPGRFTSFSWHPEISLALILTTSTEVIQRTYAWETFTSRSKPPYDSGSVAVLDGRKLLLTPFRIQNIPPPMCSYTLSLPFSESSSAVKIKLLYTPVHSSFSSSHDILAVLWESGYVELWEMHTRLGPGRGPIMKPSLMWSEEICSVSSNRQVALMTTDGPIPENSTARVIILGSDSHGNDHAIVIDIEQGSSTRTHHVELPSRNGRLISLDKTIVWQAPGGQIYEVDHDEQLSLISNFPEFCFQSTCATVSDPDGGTVTKALYVGLASSGKLYVSSKTTRTHLLASNVNSFEITPGFVIFTTTSHEAQFAPWTELSSKLTELEEDDNATDLSGWEKRRVERGSRIVTVVPSAMSLVLQMPRGNLETVNPRPLVMEVVKKDLDIGNYRKAFFACRKHRIDLNVLVDHNQETFLTRIASFVEQIDDVDHINLFLTSLGQGSQSPETITNLCDALRMQLEKRDLTRYVNSILTAYVVKTPSDHEAGLELLLRLRENEPHLVEDAVKYIIFLVDANSLYDTALGMYDFSLVLMIAQHAQKDPREYLPFLRELRELPKFYQRFRIDDHLKRYAKALKHLSLAGAEYFDEAMSYVERHQLYDEALSVWKNTEGYKSVLNVYGDWLFERREFKQSALVFILAQKPLKVMLAYEKALQWQELFELALREGVSSDEIIAMAYRVSEDLTSKKRHNEAARVLLDYAKHVRQAVIALVQGNDFSEARRIVTLLAEPELTKEIIYPGALESRAQIADDINETREQLRKQLNRIKELRIKKVEEPDAFYGNEDTNLHNVDVMTDVSMPATAFTRYTVAPTSMSKSSKRSSRSKRKLERKVGSGRKGTVDEEEYLLKSVTKLVARFNVIQGEVRGLLPHLLNFAEEHQTEAAALQRDFSQIEVELREAVEDIWKKPLDSEGNGVIDSWASRMQEKEKERKVNPIERVEKPRLGGEDWRIKLL